MKKENIYEELIELLKKHGELFAENGSIYKNKVQELTLKNDNKLIELLLSDKKFKELFFLSVGGATIFNKDKFIGLVYNKKFLPDSYTKFGNKIGLSSKDEFIAKNKEVVLNWPYKDCMLEGGMTKEDKGRDEIFWNEIIAPEHITRLKSPKAFMNAKRIDAKGSQPLQEFNRNADGTITDNLIIKGNNLLALHSLKEQFAGKVKLIYIDPPYNPDTVANTFSYKNSFNHSSWLTFMKNRAEVARNLLMDSGIYCVAIDHNELFYVGILLDEIFLRENRLGVVAVETNRGGRSDSGFFATSHEYFLVYAKNRERSKVNNLVLAKEIVDREYYLQDEVSKYKRTPLKRTGSNSTPDKRPNLNFPIFYNPTSKEISLEAVAGYEKIMPKGSNGIDRVWRWSKKKVLEDINDIEVVDKDGKFTVHVKDRIRYDKKPKTMWYGARYDASSHGTKLLQKFELEEDFSYPKSLHLMKDIISILTDPGDIILDFHGGSGTTAHAVLELNKDESKERKFILVEQMDYINQITCPRIIDVIKQNNYHSSFIYMELAEWNQKWVNEIKQAKKSTETIALWDKIKDNAFLNYKININTIDKNINEFNDLSLEDRKKFLLDCLDANHLYINYSEIEDEEYKMDDADKELSNKFYNRQ